MPMSAGTKANRVSCALPTRSVACAPAGPASGSTAAKMVASKTAEFNFIRLLQIAALAGTDQLVEDADLVRQPVVVAPVLILRERQCADRVVHAHAFLDRRLHSGIFVREHRGQL